MAAQTSSNAAYLFQLLLIERTCVLLGNALKLVAFFIDKTFKLKINRRAIRKVCLDIINTAA